jgi:cysteine-rich repeat protein
MKKNVLIISIIIASLVVIGCSQKVDTSNFPEGIPAPEQVDNKALAGQASALGTPFDYDYEFTVYNMDRGVWALQFVEDRSRYGYAPWTSTIGPAQAGDSRRMDITYSAAYPSTDPYYATINVQDIRRNGENMGVTFEFDSQCADTYTIVYDNPNPSDRNTRPTFTVTPNTRAAGNPFTLGINEETQLANGDIFRNVQHFGWSNNMASSFRISCNEAGPPAAVCGNGVRETTEQCDDGNQTDTDGCRNDCTLARCGDGVVRTGIEQCDDGNRIDTDACTNNCQLPAFTCPQGQTDCAGTCVDAQTNNANCGICGTVCNANAGQVCNAGNCINTRGTGLHDYIVGSPEPGYTATAGSTITFDVVGVDSDGDRLTLTSDHATIYQALIDQAAAAGTTVNLAELVSFQITTNEAGRTVGRLTVNSGVLPANLQAGADTVTFTLSSPDGTNAADPDPVNRGVTITFT